MSVVIMILLLGFLILIHELGHFVAARALGIRVSKFALGFPIGPTLWSKKIGDVEYLIHACLIGGYVAFPDDEKDSDLPKDSTERFVNNPVWKRMVVISAGVFMNLVVAFLLVFVVAGVWGELPSGKQQVFAGKVLQKADAPAYMGGMKDNDRILTINGSEINSSYAFSLYIKNSTAYDGKIEKSVLDDNLKTLEKMNPKLNKEGALPKGAVVSLPQNLTESALKLDDDILMGMAFYKDNQLPLNENQVRLRDDLIGKKTYISDGTVTLTDVAYAISDNIRPLNIVVMRDGKEVSLKTIYPDRYGLIQVMPQVMALTVKTKNLKDIVVEGSSYLWKQTVLQLKGFGQLITGKIPAKEVHGIVAVAKIGGDVINNGGLPSGLLLTAIISAWLAILNFFPIPALDGGHMMFLIIEKLRGKPVSEKAIEISSSIFFGAIVVLALLLIANDIYALIMHKI
ncbi:MAG: site-2 protease family protein [Muribaculaceae bacterium]|nr:site-2 protease family protein [Muribaculaceae bacterium]